MRRIFVAIAFAVIIFYPYSARADSTSLPQADTNLLMGSQPVLSQSNRSNPPIPDISGWTIVNISRIELRVSNDIVAYLGLELEFNNPANPREFVRMISRHIPLIISKHKQHNKRLFSEVVTTFYTQKEEQDHLREVTSKSDPITYIRWQIKESPRTGTDMLDSDVNIWFLPPEGVLPDGSWQFFKNKKVEIEFMTENVGNGAPRNVFSGMKYRVGNLYHIIRVDRNDLLKLFVGGK